jgi:hypothetical protein
MKTFTLYVILQLASTGNDAYWTQRNSQSPYFHEQNPIARKFVGSTAGCVTYFSASAAGHILAVQLLRKHHHNKLATFVEIEGIADHGASGIYSALHNERN